MRDEIRFIVAFGQQELGFPAKYEKMIATRIMYGV